MCIPEGISFLSTFFTVVFLFLKEESENPVTADKKDVESESMKPSATYSSSLSVSDYFAKKMEKRSKLYPKCIIV